MADEVCTGAQDRSFDVVIARDAGSHDPVLIPLRAPHQKVDARADTARTQDAVFIRDRHGLQRVERNAINLLRAEGNYVEVHTRDRRFVLRNSLRETITQLGEERFIQVNRHTAVNIGHLERVDCDSLELDGQCITLSRCYRENLMSHLNILCCR